MADIVWRGVCLRDFIARTVLILHAIGMFLAVEAASYAAHGEANQGIETLSELDEICICITGESFSYIRDEGLLTIKGGVQVIYSDYVLRCDTLEVISDGREKPVIRAYPDVSMDFANGLAEFTGSEFEYDFNTRTGGFGQTEGVVHVDPDKVEMGIDLDVPIDVHFKANSLSLYPDRFVLERPWWGLGSEGSHELGFYSVEIEAEIDDEGRITAATMDRFVVRLFGIKITLLPTELRQGFVKQTDVGLTSYFPTVAYDADDGLGINQKFFYTFLAAAEQESYISLRINPYIPDRLYWQVGLNHSFPEGHASLLYGPERIEDPFDNSQVVWSDPDFRLNYILPRVGDFSHDITGFWGEIREASRSVERERKGFEYKFNLKPVEFGNWAVDVSGAYVWNFYEGDEDYSIFRRRVSLVYDGGSDFDWKLSYICNSDDGTTPFLYDRVEVREGLQFKGQLFFSDRWGVASDLLYDLRREYFDRFGFGPIYVLESMQFGILWDFEEKTVRFLVGLPKQFF
jgi:lipopolysaccharide export system protein LptA